MVNSPRLEVTTFRSPKYGHLDPPGAYTILRLPPQLDLATTSLAGADALQIRHLLARQQNTIYRCCAGRPHALPPKQYRRFQLRHPSLGTFGEFQLTNGYVPPQRDRLESRHQGILGV